VRDNFTDIRVGDQKSLETASLVRYVPCLTILTLYTNVITIHTICLTLHFADSVFMGLMRLSK
jgi:hypothetical protein